MSDKSSRNKQLREEVKELRRKVLELQDVDIIRKQAEKKSLESDNQYRTLFENAIDAILIIDQASEKIIDCNKKAADMSGYSVRELKTMTVTELYPSEEQIVISKIFRKVAERGSLSGISGVRLLRKDGVFVPVEINAAAHEIGGESCICGMIRDVTFRKKNEDMLRESEEMARAMMDTSLDAIIMMDGNGTISYFNKAAEKMFGFRQKEVRGKKLHDVLVSKEARKKYDQSLPRFEQSGQCRIIGKTLELYASKKDGTRFPVEISVSSFHLQGKWHSVGAIRDITLRKEMEAKLRESSRTDELTGRFDDRLKPVTEKAIRGMRQHERFSNGHILKGAFDIGGDVFIKNISIGGICLRTTRMLSPDTSHKISLEGPLNRKTSMTGSVVWSAAVKTQKEINLPAFESGLKFINVKNSVKKTLQTIISRFNDR